MLLISADFPTVHLHCLICACHILGDKRGILPTWKQLVIQGCHQVGETFLRILLQKMTTLTLRELREDGSQRLQEDHWRYRVSGFLQHGKEFTKRNR